MLEPDLPNQPMSHRLLEAAHRISSCLATPGTASPEYALRSEQARVFEDFAEYLVDVATRSPADDALPFCRLILPPRTGKTVIAGHVIDRSGLSATVLVPTRTLVAQTMHILGTLLPGVPIGLLTGEEKRVVEHGINVLTHAMFRRCHETNTLPHAIGRAALVFVDEAHHAMTPGFMTALRRSFDREALRIALTATPDYSEDRRLEHSFPDLIHQLSLAEALELELLAPLRVWVAEVDAGGSKVSFVAGDFDAQVMGRLMSSAPFSSAVSVFRYGYGNVAIPALIACHTRQQASDLLEFLRAHRPPGTPEPRLILSETPRLEREESLAIWDTPPAARGISRSWRGSSRQPPGRRGSRSISRAASSVLHGMMRAGSPVLCSSPRSAPRLQGSRRGRETCPTRQLLRPQSDANPRRRPVPRSGPGCPGRQSLTPPPGELLAAPLWSR